MSFVEPAHPSPPPSPDSAIAADILSPSRGSAWLAEGFARFTQVIAAFSIVLLAWIAWEIFKKPGPPFNSTGWDFSRARTGILPISNLVRWSIFTDL